MADIPFLEQAQKVAADTMKWAGRVPGATAVPDTAAVADTAAQGFPYRVGRFAGRVLGKGFGARLGPSAMIGTMGMGMANQAANTESGATFENRPERALQILSGADITGVGGWLGNKLAGRDTPSQSNPMLGPAGQSYARAPHSPAPVGPTYTGAGTPWTSGYDLPNGPAPVTTAAPDYRSTVPYEPLKISKGANGNTVITGSGQSTDYLNRQAVHGYGANPSQPAGLARSLYNWYTGALQMRENAQNRAYNMASSKLGLDYGLKSAEASKNTAEAGKTNLMVQAALSHIAAGGSLDDLGAILSGHSVPQRFSTEPSVTGDPNAARVVTNMRTGQVFQKLPLPANIEQHIAADMKTTGKSRTDVLRAYQEKGYDVSGIK